MTAPLPPRFGLGVSNCRPPPDVVAAVIEAEAHGAEMAFIAEDINCRDAFQLSALAARDTSQIRLGIGVANPFTRNPTSLAMGAATLDEVSGGRAVLGLGTSSSALIEGQMGIPHAGALGLLTETTAVIRGLLSGTSVTYEGRALHYREAKLDYAPAGHIPIFFAAMGPQSLRLAGRLADGVLLNVGASTEYVRWAIEQVTIGALAAGRDPSVVTIAAWLTIYVTDNYDEGVERARRWLSTMLSIPRQGELLLRHGGFDESILRDIRARVGGYPPTGSPERAAPFVPPRVAEELTLIGSAGRVRERLEEYREAGVQVPVLSGSAIRTLCRPSTMGK